MRFVKGQVGADGEIVTWPLRQRTRNHLGRANDSMGLKLDTFQ